MKRNAWPNFTTFRREKKMRDTWRFLWGKTDAQSGLLHPLLFHMLDAGNVARELWSAALPASFKVNLAGDLGLDVDGAGRLIAFWTALHDMGKAGPAFQQKYAPAIGLLAAMGLPFHHRQLIPLLRTAW